MTESTLSASRVAPRTLDHALVLVTYTIAIFVNALLLFSVQPMFTKMVLPLLGGTPAVWNTALLFFQTALLLGYLYAHLTSKWLSPSRQAVLHIGLLLLALTFLPLQVPAGWRQPPESSLPIGWLLGLLTASLGLPFFALSAGAPMLQRWFAGLRHPAAANPYFLYAASNLGSFVALLSYPLLLEPNLRLGEQGRIWLVLYLVLVALLVACGVIAWRWSRAAGEAVAKTVGDEAHVESTSEIVPNRAWRLRWVLLSFAPSSLLIGVTTYLSTDIASVPFLWVIPLALYLLTFVLVFSNRPLVNRDWLLWAQLVLGLALMVSITLGGGRKMTTIGVLHLVAFFATALMCHQQLADSRPKAEHLTEFYLWMSLGGVLGGAFNAVVAPVLYETVVEYPLALVVALGLRPATGNTMGGRRPFLLDLAIPAGIFFVVAMAYQLPKPPSSWGDWGAPIFLGLMAAVAGLFQHRPLRLALAAGAIFAGVRGATVNDPELLVQHRSFFGVYRVRELFQFHVLQHGTTTHGGQNWIKEHRLDPVTYYHKEGPFGDMMSYLNVDVPLRRVAIVGLGTGAGSCFGRLGERWTFFEIDPAIVEIAKHPDLFTYLRDCPPTIDVKVGDARLTLATEPDSSIDIIVLDAFSSDAIPVHLMTREALALYLRKLRPDGAVAFHISNRYLELRPVIYALAIDAGKPSLVGDLDVTPEQRAKLYYGSRWVVVGNSERALTALAREDGWTLAPPTSDARVWTDDFSDVLGVLKR